MKILGRIPSSLDNYSIITRKDHELMVQFFEEIFFELLQRLTNWNKKEKINCFYMVDRDVYGLKTIITPRATPALAFNMFQFGLIECIYPSKNLDEINLFPHYFKEAVQLYKKKVDGERTIYLKFYSAYPDFQTKQPARHFAFVGISNNDFPLMEEARRITYDEDDMTTIMANQLASIYGQCNTIGKNSFIKTNYKGPNTLLLSKNAR